MELPCEIPQPPTVVVSIPGLLIGCYGGSSQANIFNATGVSRVSFTIVNKNLPPFTHFDLAAREGAPYALQQVLIGNSIRYIVRARATTFGVGRLELDWIYHGCPCAFGECILDPTSIKVYDVVAWDAANNNLVTSAIDGGFHPWTDHGTGAVRGSVYFSDGVSKTYAGFVVARSIDGIRLDKEHNVFSINYYDGTYNVAYFGSGYETIPPPKVVVARACLTEDCATCTDYVEIPWGGPGHPARYDFILPVPPPPSTATPTPTVTFTATPTATPSATSTPTYATDINRDSKVDVEDLLILMEDWRKVSGP